MAWTRVGNLLETRREACRSGGRFASPLPWSAGEPLPALTGESLPILFAPGLTELCRSATQEETLFWESLQAPATAAALMQEGYPRSLIGSMLDIGAIDLSSRTLATTPLIVG